MQAIILAGGRGERLLPFTADRPKCLVEVAGRPLLDHQLEWLAGQGVDEVVISCGYRWQAIRDFVATRGPDSPSIRLAVEDTPLGRGGGLRNALGRLLPLDRPILAVNGDVLTMLPPAAMAAEHTAAEAAASLLLVPYVSQHGIVDVDPGGRITGFREKPSLPYFLSGGVYILSPEVYALLPEIGDHEVSTWPALAAQGRLHGYRYYGPWRSLDSAKDVAEASRYLARRNA